MTVQGRARRAEGPGQGEAGWVWGLEGGALEARLIRLGNTVVRWPKGEGMVKEVEMAGRILGLA